jgi:hypothetical protein
MMAVIHTDAVVSNGAKDDLQKGPTFPARRRRTPIFPMAMAPLSANVIFATDKKWFMLALDRLKKHRSVMASLPISNEQPLTLECVARRSSVDMIDVAFLPGQLPVKRLDLNSTCRLFFEDEGRSFRLRAKIEEVIDNEKLRIRAIETALQYGEREYFRVNAEFSVKYRRLTDDADIKTRHFSGQMNISGSGMLLPVTERVRNGDRLSLTLILSEDPLKEVRCVARVVRTCPLAEGRQGAGLHFVEIEPQDRDAIIGFCMAAQRLELRNKVQTRDLSF